MIFTALIFGVLAGSLALIIELVFLNMNGSLSTAPVPPDFTNLAILTAAVLIEEVARMLFLHQFSRRYFAAASPTKIALILIGLLYGLGYATLELGLILSQGGAPFKSLVGIVAIHSILSLLFVFSLSGKLRFSLLWAFALGSALHLLYNLSLTYF